MPACLAYKIFWPHRPFADDYRPGRQLVVLVLSGSRVFVANDFAEPYGAFPLGVSWAPFFENPVGYNSGYLSWSQKSFIPAVNRVASEVEL